MKLRKSVWPAQEAFLDLSEAQVFTDGRARCTGVAICNEDGRPAQEFFQGQRAHFFYEFEVLGDIALPAGGVEIYDGMNNVIHGKNTFQYGFQQGTPSPELVRAGTKLRYHHVIHLGVRPGEYSFTVGLASVDAESYAAYCQGKIGEEAFAPLAREHCRVVRVRPFQVGFDPFGRLIHHGMANLPGECRVAVVEAEPAASSPAFVGGHHQSRMPTIFHITHWKAGSQWILKILKQCAPERIVEPQVGEVQFLNWPIHSGRIYPTLYITKRQFDGVYLPTDWRRFVMIRDLRDTLISAYFSIKNSHPILDSLNTVWRQRLNSLTLEEGLIYLIDEWLPGCERIQRTWVESGEPIIRYEDLLERDVEILERVLLDECQLPIDRAHFRKIVLANRFERLTKGRPRGQENTTAHERKGIAGDWENYFTDPVKRIFKERYGELLIGTGYETDMGW
jgi:lipopolysaccharide transport system ATP-binding protein